MFRKIREHLLVVIVVSLVFATLAWATYSTMSAIHLTGSDNETYRILSENSTGTATFTVTGAGALVAVTGTIPTLTVATTLTGPTGGTGAGEIADVQREHELPFSSWMIQAATKVFPSSTSTPGLEFNNYTPQLVWADGETTKATISFKVPSTYASGGTFWFFCAESDSTTPNQVDFEVYVNSDGVSVDAAASNQTPVALDQDTTTPSLIVLTVGTDFAALAANQLVTLSIWRDDTADGTGDLRVMLPGYFVCTETQ